MSTLTERLRASPTSAIMLEAADEIDQWRRQAQYETDVAEAALEKTRELCAEKAELERIIAAQAGNINALRKANRLLAPALRGLLDALPSATTHPAIKCAKDALRETDHD